MRYPQFLKDKGTIGFVAPSFGCATEPYKSAFNNALDKFQKKGYNTLLGPNCYEMSGIGISNTPKACGEELNEYYVSDTSDVLISCGGGELMCESISYVDFEAISRATPKWYMGYSDNTNFTFLLNTLCDTASIYGPCVSSFGMEVWHKSIEDAFDILTGNNLVVHNYDLWEKESLKSEDNPLVTYNTTEKTLIQNYIGKNLTNGVNMEGRLLGGCVDCLVNLTGTKYDKVSEFNKKYQSDGIIWFLECCDLNVMGIRRAMWHLEQAGWFENVKGFIIGRPLTSIYQPELMGMDYIKATLDVIAKYNVPIIMDANIGHLPPMMPIISGAYSKIVSDNNDITINYELK